MSDNWLLVIALILGIVLFIIVYEWFYRTRTFYQIRRVADGDKKYQAVDADFAYNIHAATWKLHTIITQKEKRKGLRLIKRRKYA